MSDVYLNKQGIKEILAKGLGYDAIKAFLVIATGMKENNHLADDMAESFGSRYLGSR